MKHATPEAIARIEPLLKRVRCIEGLKEKRPGIYYYKSSAFLHFHEDEDEIFADIKIEPPVFERLPVTTKHQQNILVKWIRDFIG